MRCMVLASDCEGALARHGRIDDTTWDAVYRLRASGRQIALVTGRELNDLLSLCDRVDRFACVVAENGGVLYMPATRERTLLGPPPPAFVDAMRRRGVKHLSVSETLVSTSRPYDEDAHDAIRELGLDLHVVFNGDAVISSHPALARRAGSSRRSMCCRFRRATPSAWAMRKTIVRCSTRASSRRRSGTRSVRSSRTRMSCSRARTGLARWN
ncbi:protein of unknown function (plasmid) [Caballeronia sp. S22]